MASIFSDRPKGDTLVLFDVDGTLTPAREGISPEMEALLEDLRNKVVVGYVGGSDLKKQTEQLGADVLKDFDYCFPENGLAAYRLGKLISETSFISWIGEEKYKKLVKFCLRYIANLDLPIMRGTFIEFRKGMINVSPIGRNASIQERKDYEVFDLKHKIRENFIKAIQDEFPDYGLTYSIGGQISFDVFPTGWDKTYCLGHVQHEGFKEVHFFGDKTYKGGNDYEIFTDPRTIGHSVKNPDDTAKILKQLFYS